jgi:hypothetical protein
MKIEEELWERCKGVPPRAALKSLDPMLYARLYWPIGQAEWFIAGYDHELASAYGLVRLNGRAEWGYFRIPELQASRIAGIKPLVLDSSFQPTLASRLKGQVASSPVA